jgi:hemerythrin-like domain-containing protein
MRATAILREEHDAILRMLDVLAEISNLLGRGVTITPEKLTRTLEVLRVYADRCHHGKEEGLLFPLLVRKGMPTDSGPTGVMLHEHEHEQGRLLIQQMTEAAESYNKDKNGAQWIRAARGYAALLRDHIANENNILFVMADSSITEEENSQLVSDFEAEIEKIGTDTNARMHRLMKELSADILGDTPK